jgi:tetratricopeptide (TPR) repeat protein
MIKKYNWVIIFFLSISLTGNALSENNFFLEAKKNYDEKKYDESKFLFQKNIVFNPKDESSYLYLAKIYNFEENEKEKEKNINTVLLLNPKNEEAIYILMEIELKKSNYSKVQQLAEKFTIMRQIKKKKKKI